MKTVGGHARFLVKNLEGWAFSRWLPRQDFITKEIRPDGSEIFSGQKI